MENGNTHRSGSQRHTTMFKLSQETIAIVTVGLALAGLVVASDTAIRSDMQAMRAEARADREAWQAESVRLRAEDRADRDEARADREAFEKHITRLTQEQSRLTGMVEQMRTAAAR